VLTRRPGQRERERERERETGSKPSAHALQGVTLPLPHTPLTAPIARPLPAMPCLALLTVATAALLTTATAAATPPPGLLDGLPSDPVALAAKINAAVSSSTAPAATKAALEGIRGGLKTKAIKPNALVAMGGLMAGASGAGAGAPGAPGVTTTSSAVALSSSANGTGPPPPLPPAASPAALAAQYAAAAADFVASAKSAGRLVLPGVSGVGGGDAPAPKPAPAAAPAKAAGAPAAVPPKKP